MSPDLSARKLNNGREYCAELAATEEQQESCMGELEDGLFYSNRDKERAATTLRKGVERIKLSREPCRWWEWRCRREARKLRDAPARP